MGLFTYRQMKKTKNEVRKLRSDQRELAAAHGIEQRALAAQARETELFQQLPPEGKAEFRAFVHAYSTQFHALGKYKFLLKDKQIKKLFNELNTNKAAVFRKYDLIP
jgi:hypothetical protein